MPTRSTLKTRGAPSFSDDRPAKGDYFYDATADRTEILWKCLTCGELKQRNHWTPGVCPSCGAPKSQFVLVDED
jgi:rubrerythrin